MGTPEAVGSPEREWETTGAAEAPEVTVATGAAAATEAAVATGAGEP